jgi:hypothetical protein
MKVINRFTASVRIAMNARNNSLRRAATWMSVLPMIAIGATLVSVPAARAQDFNQQATSAQKDDALNWGAATGFGNAYRRAPDEFQRPPHFRSHNRY